MQTLCGMAHFDYRLHRAYSYEQAFNVMRALLKRFLYIGLQKPPHLRLSEWLLSLFDGDEQD